MFTEPHINKEYSFIYIYF